MAIEQLEQISELRDFVQTLIPEQKEEDNAFIVDGIEIKKNPFIPYLKIAQGNEFIGSSVAGQFAVRVERKNSKTVEVNGKHYIPLGKKTRAVVIGIARAGLYRNEQKVVRFIPITQDTPIPAEWIEKTRKVTYVALYFPEHGVIAIVEGVGTRRRITDRVVEEMRKSPSFMEIEMEVTSERNEKGTFLAPKLITVKRIKGNTLLETLRDIVRNYFIERLETTKKALQRQTQVQSASEIEKAKENNYEENEIPIEEDEDEIPF